MDYPYQNSDSKNYLKEFNESLANVKQGRGSIICVTGETGFGKSHLLDMFLSIASQKNSGVSAVYVETPQPIGSFKIGKIQPLLPFKNAIEKLISDKDTTPEKRFAMQTAMTGLAVIPILGEFFYAVKEISRDWRQYKREKSSESNNKVSTATAEFYDTLAAITDKKPCVIIIDDLHWADIQSIELLNLLSDNIATIPLVLVITLKRSILQTQASPLITFLEEKRISPYVQILDLKPYDNNDINKLCKLYFPYYITNLEFEDWLFEHTYGVPADVVEYLKYFQQNSPFDKEGKVVTDFYTSELLPTSIHSALAQNISKLTEDEINLLSICAAEGKEFTAMVVAELLNTDVLTTIKKLRSLQHRTGIIKSIGANNRYGVKTTIYQFTQAFYHTYFEKLLEYEEYTALHGQIARLLKKRYDEASSEVASNQIAPYLAAHSIESGDDDTAKTMILQTARAAKELGSNEILSDIYTYFSNINDETKETESNISEKIAFTEMLKNFSSNITPDPTNNNSLSLPINIEEILEFNKVRNAITDCFFNKKLTESIGLANDILETRKDILTSSEKSQLYLLISRIYLALDDIQKSISNCENAISLAKEGNDEIMECVGYNLFSIILFSQGKYKDSEEYLKKATDLTFSLPKELKMLTLANVAILYKTTSPQDYANYLHPVSEMAKELNYMKFYEDISSGK